MCAEKLQVGCQHQANNFSRRRDLGSSPAGQFATTSPSQDVAIDGSGLLVGLRRAGLAMRHVFLIGKRYNAWESWVPEYPPPVERLANLRIVFGTRQACRKLILLKGDSLSLSSVPKTLRFGKRKNHCNSKSHPQRTWDFLAILLRDLQSNYPYTLGNLKTQWFAMATFGTLSFSRIGTRSCLKSQVHPCRPKMGGGTWADPMTRLLLIASRQGRFTVRSAFGFKIKEASI